MQLLILGGGFTGLELGKVAVEQGVSVAVTLRREERRALFESANIRVVMMNALSAELLAPYLSSTTNVVVTFPPDGVTDARIVDAFKHCRAIAYVSSTGVYGSASGNVDEQTPAAPPSSRYALRLAAESIWRDGGAVVVRAPGIYGPSRGMHMSLKNGTLKIGGDGSNVLSRIHVHDLARALFQLVTENRKKELYVIGDDEPTPIGTVADWLSATLNLPPAPRVPMEEVGETMRSNRSIINHRIKSALNFKLKYPTYREGFSACNLIS